jgi:hypothetical protein
VKVYVDCHRAEPGKGPRSLSALLPSIPKIPAAMIRDMIERSELGEQDEARFLDYAKNLAKSIGP